MPKKGTRAVGNPLALAVLAALMEGPSHPYEIARSLRERRKEKSIPLNYGTLYTVVRQLSRHGFVVATEIERDGGLPERTVYALTQAGRGELMAWMRELLGSWRKEYHEFEAALALLYVLPPDEVASLLRSRCRHLDEVIREERLGQEAATNRGVHRLFLVESEYRLALLDAERGCIDGYLNLIEDGDPTINRWWRELTLRSPAQ